MFQAGGRLNDGKRRASSMKFSPGVLSEVAAGMIGHLNGCLAVGHRCRVVAICGGLAVCASLTGCGPFSATVADNWPHWAGGMPEGVPPRPGSPGYDEFIAHQQGKQASAPISDAQKASSSSSPGPAGPAQTVSANSSSPAPMTAPTPAPQPIPTSAVTNGQLAGPGGLY
jgi:hypothetical protein